MMGLQLSAGKLLAGVAAIGLCASLAVAQDAPESLLPPGFDDPTPAPRPTPAVRPTSGPASGPAPAPQPGTGPLPTVQPVPGQADLPPVPDMGSLDLSRIPSIEALEEMSTDELDDLLGLKPRYDIPPGARRSLAQVGLLSNEEGGLPVGSLDKQPASLVRAVLSGTKGPMVSRWGHILLRRALASRLNAPAQMSPVEFAALRAQTLNNMGEYVVARSLVQDVDTGNYSAALTDAALEAYIATSDIVGACPAVRFIGSERDDPQWTMLSAICNAYAGEGALAGTQLDRALRNEIAPRIDVLLAQRFAGAAGRGRRAVSVEWDDIDDMNPWRFALANAVGEQIPEALRGEEQAYYQRISAIAPMLPLELRAAGATRAAREGILSSTAMIDLYSQIYADDALDGEVAERAARLREAYVGNTADDRLAAMKSIWGGQAADDYSNYVLTAYAAARFMPDAAYGDDAGSLIASMLSAGLDRDALAWSGMVEEGSESWAMLQLARSGRAVRIDSNQIDAFVDDDGSPGQRKSKFLVAAIAGLERASASDINNFSDRLDMDLSRRTKWSQTISAAARFDNVTLVSMLAGLGMQGESWKQMTPLHLFHIVSALNKVGLQAEARMIAAEAIARG